MDKMAAGVVQTTNKMTMAMSTTTNMRSSGLCNPLLLCEALIEAPPLVPLNSLDGEGDVQEGGKGEAALEMPSAVEVMSLVAPE